MKPAEAGSTESEAFRCGALTAIPHDRDHHVISVKSNLGEADGVGVMGQYEWLRKRQLRRFMRGHSDTEGARDVLPAGVDSSGRLFSSFW